MAPNQSIDKKVLSEVQNWLITATEFPRRTSRIYQRAVDHHPEWIPALIYHALHDTAGQGHVATLILERLVRRSNDSTLLMNIANNLPFGTSRLTSIALKATSKVCRVSHRQTLFMGSEAVTRFLLSWNTLAERLFDEGYLAHSVNCGRMAVMLSTCLPEEENLPRVACLLTLSRALGSCRKHKEALETAKEAFALAVTSASREESRRFHLLAQSAAMVSHGLGVMGRFSEAKAYAQASIETLKKVPESRETHHDTAVTQDYLVTHMLRQGNYEDALPLAENVERIYRVLSADNPEQYDSASASTAVNYSHLLSAMGQFQRAYDLAFTSAEQMRDKAKQQPKRFGLAFAAQLIAISKRASDLRRLEEALRFGEEAVSQARKYAKMARRHDWFIEGSAISNLAQVHYKTGNIGEAVRMSRQAEAALARIRRTHPEGEFHYVTELLYLAEFERLLARDNNLRMALKTARRAARLSSRPRYHDASDAWKMLQAYCLTILADCLEDAGNPARSLEQELKSISLRRELFSRRPLVYQLHLAYGETKIAGRLLNKGDLRRALEFSEKAVLNFEQGLPRADDNMIRVMAVAFLTLGEAHFKNLKPANGFQVLEKGIRLIRPYYESNPDSWLTVLINLCEYYAELNKIAGVEYNGSFIESVLKKARGIEGQAH